MLAMNAKNLDSGVPESRFVRKTAIKQSAVLQRVAAIPGGLDQFLQRADQCAKSFGQQAGIEWLLERFVNG